MLEFTILYISSDITSSKPLISQLDLPSDIHFIFCDSGIEALSIASDHTIGLIILSEFLTHKMSGSEVCKLLINTEKTEKIPILFLSDSTPIEEFPQTVKHLKSSPSLYDLQHHISIQYQYAQSGKELQREKNLILSIVNKVHSPIFIISYDKISFANQYFLDFFGLNSLEDFPSNYTNMQDLFLHDTQVEPSSLQWIKELLHEHKEKKVIMQNAAKEQITVKVRG